MSFRYTLLLLLLLLPLISLQAGYSDERYYNEFGMMAGESNNKNELAFVTGVKELMIQRKNPGYKPLLTKYAYGIQDFQLELGSGFGIAGTGLPGSNLNFGYLDYLSVNGFALHLGLEALNFRYSANTNGRRLDFFEWQPMHSFGARFQNNELSGLLYFKAGASIGTIANAGARPAYGIETILIYRSFDFNTGFIRVLDTVSAFDFWDAGLTYRINMQYSFALNAKFLLFSGTSNNLENFQNYSDGHIAENRIYFTLRYSPLKSLYSSEFQI
ncbi:MAG: hypothetical protein KDK41_03215 [Leptospiraceae bacterium]|nr:hypothetical protein [Leptospiraceae bacterium]